MRVGHFGKANLVVVSLSFSASLCVSESYAAEEAHAIEEVVVTARKRAESAMDSPVPVTVLSQSAIEDRAIESLDDVAANVPGLIIGETSGTSGGSLYLRGIGSAEANPLIEQALATNIDGVLAGSAQIRRAAFMDMAQVEVLKGPQALFFGKNSPAGVISITTADPGDQFEAKVRVSREFEADEDTIEAIVSGPITDSLGGRLAVSYTEAEGYFDIQQFDVPGLTPIGESRYPGVDELFLRGTLNWEIGDATSAKLKFTLSDTEYNSGIGTSVQRGNCPTGAPQLQPVNFECKVDDTIQNAGIPRGAIELDPTATDFSPSGFRDNDQKLGSLEINHDISDTLQLTSITGFYDVDEANSTSYAIGPFNTINSPNNTFEMEQWSQELRLLSDFDGVLNFMVDGYYETRDSSSGTSAVVFNALFLGREVFEQDQTAWSLAAQLIWSPTDALEVTLGGRFSREDKDIDIVFNGDHIRSDSADWDNFSPEVTVSYDLNDDWMIYGSYKEGFKSGGFDASFGAAGRNDPPYDQEEVDGFEFGAKGLLLDRSLSLNAVIYRYEYDGLQVSTFDVTTTSLRVRNATTADVQGFEVDFVWQTPIDGLRLSGAYAYNDSEYGEFFTQCYSGQSIARGCDDAFNPATGVYGAQNIKGDTLILAPESSASLGVEYERMLNDNWNLLTWVNWRYSDDYLSYAGGPESAEQDSFSKIDATISLSSQHWEFALKGRNLTDKITLMRVTDVPLTGFGTGTAGGVEGDRAVSLSRPRELMLQITYRY